MDITPSLQELQKMQEDGTNVPFKIMGINEKGYFGKVFNWNAFVSFSNMPFEYKDRNIYRAFLPSFKQIIFNAKIAIVDIEKEFCILSIHNELNETVKLDPGIAYPGIITYKMRSSLILEIGIAFDWKYGSIQAFLPKSLTDRIIFYNDLQIGDTLPVTFFEYEETKQINHIVQGAISSKEWTSGIVWEYLFKEVQAKVSYHESKIIFVIDEKHKAELSRSQKWYKKTKLRYMMKGIINGLQEGEIITAKVIRLRESDQIMEIEWIIDNETEENYLSGFKNTLGDLLKKPIEFSS